jgi:rod shape-determining protein MreD
MSFLLGIPILFVTAILQTTVLSRMPLLNGTADLMLVVISAWALQRQITSTWLWALLGGMLIDYYSGLPFGIFTLSYLAVNGAALILRSRIWQFSYLMHLFLALLGTLMIHTFSVIIILLQGTTLPVGMVLQQVTLPSLILNLLMTFPVYLLIKDVAEQIQPSAVNL